MAFSKREAPNCSLCPYQKNCLFSYLDKSSQKEWKEIRIANRFRKGETIFHEGENPPGLYVVCTGKAKIYKTSRTGDQLLTRVEEPGDLLGHRSLLAQENYSGEATAMQETVVSLIDTDNFFNFLNKHFNACLALLKALSLDVRRGEEKARDIAYKPAKGRLSEILVRTMHKNGSPVYGKNLDSQPSLREGKLLVSGYKRKELAEMAGLTVETTVRMIRQFEKQGLLKKQGKDLQILDEKRLRLLSGNLS
ncbi:MAG: Crp/Fnr family transcriptional regulator [Elusimicrobia bacterium]|nr:Crp/Fnr family transcriptional regulator [Elusimicrobiota bacterium]